MFDIFEPGKSANDYMVLDSQALQHLEILESADGGIKGSLFEYVDHCKTPFGKRQLRRWLVSPLNIVDKLNSRLDAVEDLMSSVHEADLVRYELSKLPDIEKLLARVFSYSIKHKVKAVYFEDVNLSKMQEFRKLLNAL